jgi:hypothetical protein
MSEPPDLIPLQGDWSDYEDEIYEAFLNSFVQADVRFRGWRVTVQRRPETHGKGYSFWHIISEAPDDRNRKEEDRIPNLRRCERVRWISWAIENAGREGFLWWENRRSGDTRVIIWVRDYDFAVVLAKRKGYYMLKTAYAEITDHRRRTFEAELAAFWKAQKS